MSRKAGPHRSVGRVLRFFASVKLVNIISQVLKIFKKNRRSGRNLFIIDLKMNTGVTQVYTVQQRAEEVIFPPDLGQFAFSTLIKTGFPNNWHH